jgi:hypothetical protein
MGGWGAAVDVAPAEVLSTLEGSYLRRAQHPAGTLEVLEPRRSVVDDATPTDCTDVWQTLLPSGDVSRFG